MSKKLIYIIASCCTVGVVAIGAIVGVNVSKNNKAQQQKEIVAEVVESSAVNTADADGDKAVTAETKESEEAAITEESSEVALEESEAMEEESEEEEEAYVKGDPFYGTLFSNGNVDEAFEDDYPTWLWDAKDTDYITVIYTCADPAHAGWGLMGWGAVVKDQWTESFQLAANDSKYDAKCQSTMTISAFRKSFGASEAMDISMVKLSVWNGGKILSIATSKTAPKAAADVVEAKIEESAGGSSEGHVMTGSYASSFGEGTFEIGIKQYCPNYIPGDTIAISVTMESTAQFKGCLGATQGKDYAWDQHDYSSADGSKVSVGTTVTTYADTFQLQVWYSQAGSVGANISVTKVADGEGSAGYAGALQLIAGPVRSNTAVDYNPSKYCPDFEEGDTISVSVTLFSASFFNGCLGMADATGKKENWHQTAYEASNGGTTTVSLTVGPAADYGQIQFWWSNEDVAIKSISVSIVKKGEAGDGEEEEEGEGEGEGGEGDSGNTGSGDSGNTGSGDSGNTGSGDNGGSNTNPPAENALPQYSQNADWLFGAKDLDVVVLKFSCTEPDHKGWGIGQFQAIVEGEADQRQTNLNFNADASDAANIVTVKLTAKELKDALQLTGNETVTMLQFATWNGGKFEEMYLEVADENAKAPDYAATANAEGTEVLSQAAALTEYNTVDVETFTPWGGSRDFDDAMDAETVLVVTYEGAAPQLFMQDPWKNAQAKYDANGKQIYTYDDIVTAFGSSNLNKMGLQAKGADVTITSVKYVGLVYEGDNGGSNNNPPAGPIATLNKTDSTAFETKMGTYASESLAAGDNVTVSVVFDGTHANFGGCISGNDSVEANNWKQVEAKGYFEEKTCTADFTLQYDGDWNALKIEMWWCQDANGDEVETVDIKSITVTKNN
ncbi:MAG: hypothetical protein MJ114_03575 [Acetatifactor sp.]|nr:hypothetical protein [Acetatifactor sp.]